MRIMKATLALAFIFTANVIVGCSPVKTKTVTADSVAQLPSGKSFVADLTQKGTIYKFGDAGTDFSRVTIRTVSGEKTLADLLKASNTNFKGRLVLGTIDDMRNHLPSSSGVTTAYDCGVICQCTGGADCMDMIAEGKCMHEFWCTDNHCYCVARS